MDAVARKLKKKITETKKIDQKNLTEGSNFLRIIIDELKGYTMNSTPILRIEEMIIYPFIGHRYIA